jgi:putative colanic acid biosynthesis acetyltransferase WcaF
MTNYTPVQTTPFSIKIKIMIRIWQWISVLLYRPSPWFLKKYRVALLRVFGADVHWSANPHPKARVDCPWNLKMEALSSIGEGSWIYALDRIEIGRGACVGQDVYLITGSHDVDDAEFKFVSGPIKIGEGAWLATRANVLPGVDIGAYSVIALGAVVTKNVQERKICGGNPCRELRDRTFK